MRGTRRYLTFMTVVTVILLAVYSNTSIYLGAGEIQPGFNQAIMQVHLAESAGATQSEIAGLVTTLNKALELNEQALALTSPNQTQQRAALLSQVNAMLNAVQTSATTLETVASQRTQTNDVLAYVYGGLAAAIGTLAYAALFTLYRRRRIKRTFQMKVTAK